MAKKSNQSLAKRNTGLSGKSMLNDPAPAGGLEMSLVIMIGDEEIVLTGDSFKDGIDISYSQHWDEAVEIGTFMDGITALGNALKIPDLAEDVKKFIEGLPAPLSNVAKFITNSTLILTDLVINTTGKVEKDDVKKDVYTLGLGFKFPEIKPIAGISAKAFLVKYTHLTDHKKS